jgi:hypothetical protein
MPIDERRSISLFISSIMVKALLVDTMKSSYRQIMMVYFYSFLVGDGVQ